MHVRTLCLGILNFEDATGYEIKKMSIDGRFSHFIDVSYGSIYPALLRLTEEGLILCREEQQAGKPDRKVYSITPAGRAELQRTLEEDPAPDKFKSEFLFLMVCAGLMDRERIARAVDDRIAALDGEITRLEEAQVTCQQPSSQYVIGYGLAVCRASRQYLIDERATAVKLGRSPATGAAAE